MNTLHHFGDSYGCGCPTEKHFVELISNQINYNYSVYGVISGQSNEQILTLFLKKIFEYKKNDILFFNFSFFERGAYWDFEEKRIKSTNSFYNESVKEFTIQNNKNKKEYVQSIIFHQLSNGEDYNRKLFTQFDVVFKQLISIGVHIYYIFISESEFSKDLIKNGIHIKFPNSFEEWLNENNFHNQECCHYSFGVQNVIKDYVLDLHPEILNFTLPSRLI